MTNLCVLGVGYVGLVTGTCFADLGNCVTCVDVDEDRINRLRAGQMPIREPGLEEMVRRNVAVGRLRFSTSVAEALPEVEFVFIAVGTPSGPMVPSLTKTRGGFCTTWPSVRTRMRRRVRATPWSF